MRFVYKEHPEFSAPDDLNSKLWRYMDIAKFLSLLEDEALFFASAASMPDKFEGSRSRLTSALNASLGEAHAAFDARIDSPFNKLLRGYTYLSCWHSSPHESAAMWALYQHDGYGVAIQSTFKRLTESFKGEQTIYAGCVHYVDYDTVAIPDGNSYTPYLYKRLSFEHEREVRAIAEDHYTGWQAWQQANIVFNPSISVRPGQDIDAELKRLDEAYRNLEPDIAPRPGIAVPVDLGELVEKVYIAPEAPGWVAALIEKLLHRYDLIWPIRQSDLRRDPFY